MAQAVKNPPAVQETQVQSLDQEDPLQKEMATHSSTVAWKIPWTEEPGRLQPMGLQRVRHRFKESLNCAPLDCKAGEGNGTPLQSSCLENPMDGGAW